MTNSVHPIVNKLRERRRDRHISQQKLAETARVSDTFICNHEKDKFSALNNLDRWAKALGYRLALIDEYASEDESEFRVSDWRLRS